MKRVSLKWLGVFAAVGFCLSWAATPAEAAFRLRLEDLSTNMGVVLTGTEVPGNNPSGSITFSGSIGVFSIVVTTTVTSHSGTHNYAELDLNNITVIGTGAGVLQITAEDTDYTRGTGATPLELKGTLGGTLTGGPGSSIDMQSWANGTNAAPNLGTDAGTTSTAVSLVGNPVGPTPAGSTPAFVPDFVSGPGAFSTTGVASFNSPTSYSLFAQATLTFDSTGGSASFDDDQQVLPEPSTIAMAATCLPLLAGFALRRYRKNRAA